MTSQKLGLTLPDKQLNGQTGLMSAILADLLTLEHGATVVTTIEPVAPHAGLIWANPDDDSVQVWSDIAEDWVPFSTGGDVTAHIASSPATHAAGSITDTHLASNSVTSGKIASDAVVAGKIAAGGVSASNQLAAGVADDTAVGNRTVDQTLATPANTGPLTSLLSWIAGRIKAITGESDWKTTPQTTLAAARAHHDSNAPHSGHETPAGAQTKVNAHAALNGAHGVYSGSGSPEGVVAASPPAIYIDSASGGGIWRKNSGAGNTGWVRSDGMRIKSIQRGTLVLDHVTSGTATITAVDTAKSELRLLGSTTDSESVNHGVRIKLTNSTTITGEADSSQRTNRASWEVTEWE